MIVALALAAASTTTAADIPGILWTLVGGLAIAVVGIVGNLLVKRFRSRASEPEMWRRLDELSVAVYGGRNTEGVEVLGLQRELEDTRVELGGVKRKAAAQGRIIAAVVRQAPAGFVPRLNPEDLAEIDGDTIPIHSPWRQRP